MTMLFARAGPEPRACD